MRPLNLFDLYAKISLDDSDYNAGIEKATKSGESFASKLKSGLSTAGKAAATGLGVITTAAGAVAGGLVALEASTEQYRIAQGRLNTAFENAGYSAETAKQAYSDLYGVLGDTDRATEASQLLARLAENEDDLSSWTKIAAGVNGTFGDSLPIESLIEAANETARTGQVVGTLADALNWAGEVGEDEMNAMLESCSSEAERNQLIMETLAGTYDDAADAFYRNNEALVSSRDAQVQMDEAMAQLGQTVSTVKGQLTSEFLPSISEVATAFSGLISGTEGADQKFSQAIGNLVTVAVEQLPSFLSFGTQIITSLLSGIVQSIPTLVAAVPQIVNEIGTAFANLFPQVLDMGVQLLDQLTTGVENGLPDMLSRIPEIIVQFLEYITGQLPTILQKGVEILNSLVTGIIDTISNMVTQLPQIITAFINFIAESLPQIVSAGVDILSNLIKGILSLIPTLIANMPKIIVAIVNGLGKMAGSIVEAGKEIIRGLWNGISDMAGWIANKIQGFGEGVLNALKDFFGIASPSKLFENEVGHYLAQGIGVGFEDEMGAVAKEMQNAIPTPTVGTVDFASSGLGMSQKGIAGALNGIAATVGQSFTITVQSVLDGKIIGETAYQYSRNKARAYGG